MAKRIYRINNANWKTTRRETKIKRLEKHGFSRKYADYKYSDLTSKLRWIFDPATKKIRR